ncbi:MAG: hypothetical protein IJQ28_04090, partial [Clostridia bacterium]|nr:hypothetical protein [Clostridia bacterium]
MKKKNAIKWILENGKNSFPAIILLSIISITLSLIQINFATASKDVMDIATRQMEGVLKDAFLVLLALLLVRLVLQIAVSYVNVHACSRFEIALK